MHTPLPENFIYIPNFLNNTDEMMLYFSKHLERKQYPITLFGKTVLQPRLVCFYSNPGISYSYSKTTLLGTGRDTPLYNIQQNIEKKFGLQTNSVLCNLYRNENDSMGWHSDDETELGPDPHIASVTLGAHRIFKIRNKKTKETHNILLEHGSLLLMKERSQIDREHSIAKTRKKTGPRLNFTFRYIYQEFQKSHHIQQRKSQIIS